VLAEILREKRNPQALLKRARLRIPQILAAAPEVAELAHDYLKQAASGRAALRLHSDDLKRLADAAQAGHRQTVFAVIGVGLMLVGAVLYGLRAGGPAWLDIPAAVWIAAVGALGAFLAAWPRRG
jgi:ubiquinone biosynthesis protein